MRITLFCAEKVLTIKHYSVTIPDDPHMHQLLLRLLAAVRAELQQPDGGSGDACRPGTATADAGSAEAAQAASQVQHSCRGSGASVSEAAGPGAPGAGMEKGPSRAAAGVGRCLCRPSLEHALLPSLWQRRWEASLKVLQGRPVDAQRPAARLLLKTSDALFLHAGTPPGQAVGDEKDNAAPMAGAAADSQATGCINNVAAAATPCGLRRRQRSKQPSQQLLTAL